MKRHCYRLTLLMLALAVTASAASPAKPKTPEELKPKAEGEAGREVALYVTVQKDNKLVGGLTEENFRLQEDGEPRDFELQEPEKPASVALLLEFSRGSWLYLSDIASAMSGFVDVAPEGHWYALATFAHELNIAVDFTKQRGEISQGFSTLQAPTWNEVDTYDAVYNMLDKMGRLPGRRVMIAVGSGFDDFSSHTLDDVKKELEGVNVNVFTLGAGSALRTHYQRYMSSTQRLEFLQAENFMRMLADKSGGWASFPRFPQAFPESMKGIMQMLKFQYKLVYQSQVPRDGEFHDIELQAFRIVNDQREDFDVFVRDGWRLR